VNSADRDAGLCNGLEDPALAAATAGLIRAGLADVTRLDDQLLGAVLTWAAGAKDLQVHAAAGLESEIRALLCHRCPQPAAALADGPRAVDDRAPGRVPGLAALHPADGRIPRRAVRGAVARPSAVARGRRTGAGQPARRALRRRGELAGAVRDNSRSASCRGRGRAQGQRLGDGGDAMTTKPYTTVTVRIRGDRDIALWKALALANGLRSCKLAARLLQEAIAQAAEDPHVTRLASLLPDPSQARQARNRQPRHVHLLDQVMAVLNAEAPLPVSTTRVLRRAAIGESDRPLVLRLLNEAALDGDVEKIRLDGMRCRYWRSWPGGEPQ
jgi:hypothetical protein